jgi:hypothetical protein
MSRAVRGRARRGYIDLRQRPCLCPGFLPSARPFSRSAPVRSPMHHRPFCRIINTFILLIRSAPARLDRGRALFTNDVEVEFCEVRISRVRGSSPRGVAHPEDIAVVKAWRARSRGSKKARPMAKMPRCGIQKSPSLVCTGRGPTSPKSWSPILPCGCVLPHGGSYPKGSGYP